MDKSLERLALLANIGSFAVALLSVPWLAQIFGLPAPPLEFSGYKLPSFDISALPFPFRISAALLLAFAYCWLFSFMSVFLVATRNPAGWALAAIVTFFASVIVLSTILSVGFNLLAQPGPALNDLPSNAQGWLYVCGFAGWLLFTLCGASHWLREPELQGKDLGGPSVWASAVLYSGAAASLWIS